jgi:hypothetical protein
MGDHSGMKNETKSNTTLYSEKLNAIKTIYTATILIYSQKTVQQQAKKTSNLDNSKL